MLHKRVFDFIFSFILLLLLSPILLLISILIKITTKGPLFYKWKIIGKNEVPITSYKFRSMVSNAEQVESNLREKGLNEMSDVYFKLKEDNRITRIGKVLRKFSLDEIPQLFSVLKGDMSLVGPRPVRQSEYKFLDDAYKDRFNVKPGATSLWVVNGKNEINNFIDIYKLDKKYINEFSFWLDIKILLKTIPIIILGKNN